MMTNQSNPSGIISDFLTHMTKKVCGVCPSHGDTDINFRTFPPLVSLDTRKKRLVADDAIIKEFDLMFPVLLGPG